MKTIALAGNPNVGKSVLFNKLTGMDVSISNYPGTTVDYTEGTSVLEDEKYKIVDLPGSFSLEARDKAEKVTKKMLREIEPEIVVSVIDATSIERGLYLFLELAEREHNLIILLNMSDEAKDKNIEIDSKELEEILEIPVISTVAPAGIGLEEFSERIKEASKPKIGKIKSRFLKK